MSTSREAFARGETIAVAAAPSTIAAGSSIEFLQRRVAVYGLALFCLAGAFLLLRNIAAAATWQPETIFESHNLWHLVLALCFLGMWLACRRGPRTARFVRGVEIVGLVGAAVSTLLMGAGIPFTFRPDFIILFALMSFTMGRAVFIPSTARNTAALGVVIAIPLVVAAYGYAERADPALIALSLPGDSPLVTAYATAIAVNTALWWAAITALATATSRVIYGLRTSVREARRVGQYQLEEKLAEGGMGVVYRANHAMLKRPTAVKVLRSRLDGEQQFLDRFEREVQLTAKLTHPNTITIYDYGHTPEGRFYYAMELLDGADLGRVVSAGGPLPPGRVIHILAQAAASLAEAHEAGLIHRDIKPQNVMLCRQGGEWDVIKVLDFGLVKETDGEDIALSRASEIAGTPQYMSPEALRAEPLDARSDLYCLGAVGYFLLTGTHVFSANTAVELGSKHLASPPEPPSSRLGRTVPEDLEATLLACLEKRPADRPSDAPELRARLLACRDAGTWSAADAEAWWRAHAGRLVASADNPATAPTILESAGAASGTRTGT